MMVDLASLLQAVPVSGLEPCTLAFVRGLAAKVPSELFEPTIELLEPPASHRVPFVDPLRALTILFRQQGDAGQTARCRARDEWSAIRTQVARRDRAVFFDPLEPDTPECIPAPALMDYLRDRH